MSAGLFQRVRPVPMMHSSVPHQMVGRTMGLGAKFVELVGPAPERQACAQLETLPVNDNELFLTRCGPLLLLGFKLVCTAVTSSCNTYNKAMTPLHAVLTRSSHRGMSFAAVTLSGTCFK
jgi:hypothetical protein